MYRWRAQCPPFFLRRGINSKYVGRSLWGCLPLLRSAWGPPVYIGFRNFITISNLAQLRQGCKVRSRRSSRLHLPVLVPVFSVPPPISFLLVVPPQYYVQVAFYMQAAHVTTFQGHYMIYCKRTLLSISSCLQVLRSTPFIDSFYSCLICPCGHSLLCSLSIRL
jgi:hypothetical protein